MEEITEILRVRFGFMKSVRSKLTSFDEDGTLENFISRSYTILAKPGTVLGLGMV
jgi:hypothetical protein